MEPHVSIKNLRKVFNGNGPEPVTAIDGLSLDIPQGQFLAVMGPSGSGKTTLLHLIAGLSQPTSGDVVVNGTNLATLNDRQLTLFRRQNIGVIFQSFNLIPTLTTEENFPAASSSAPPSRAPCSSTSRRTPTARFSLRMNRPAILIPPTARSFAIC